MGEKGKQRNLQVPVQTTWRKAQAAEGLTRKAHMRAARRKEGCCNGQGRREGGDAEAEVMT